MFDIDTRVLAAVFLVKFVSLWDSHGLKLHILQSAGGLYVVLLLVCGLSDLVIFSLLRLSGRYFEGYVFATLIIIRILR